METHDTKIYSGSMMMVTNVVAKLEEIGITPVVKDESESGRLAGFGSAIQYFQEVYIRNDELDKAVPIVQSAVAEMEA